MLLLKKMGAKNYFVVMLILMVITALLVISTFILTAFFPDALGHSPYNYEISTVCEFEPWSFEIDGLKVSLPQGGVIVTVNDSDHKRSVMLLGEGSYEQNGLKLNTLNTGGLFMVLDHSLFEKIRGNNIFMPVEDTVLLSYVEAIFNQQTGMPAVWDETIPLTFHATEGLIYYYFLSAEGGPILPPEINGSTAQVLVSVLIYFLIIVIILFVIAIFSSDHHYSRYWLHLGKTPPGVISLAIIPLIAVLVLIGDISIKANGWSGYYAAFGYVTAILLLILSSRYGKIDYLDFGLRRDRIRHGYLLASLSAALLIGITRGIPVGISNEIFSAVLRLPVIFLVIALPQEMIWRGYIQTVLSRQLDPTRGLLAMIFIAAIVRFVYLMATAPWMIAYPYTYLELAVLVPGTAALLGYVYLRTENILACALMHSLVLWLPGIILF